MTPPSITSRQALLAVLLAGTMALGACGRRGRPEPPPDPNAPVKTQADAAAGKPDGRSAKAQPAFQTKPGLIASDDDDDEDPATKPDPAGASPLPTATPAGSRKKASPYVVPKEPFILDPLL